MKVLDDEALQRRIDRLDELASDVRVAIAINEVTGTPVPVLAPEVLNALTATADKLRALPEANTTNELRPRD